MIRAADIGVVVQGDMRPNTGAVIAAVRSQLPGARLVLSTYEDARADVMASGLDTQVDQVVYSADPGPLPPTIRSRTAPPNNVNRQIVTSRAGLAGLDTRYALKLRSDALLDARALVAAWDHQHAVDGRGNRIAVANLYTRHPHGINGYLFHVSDWIQFGEAAHVRDFWNVGLMGRDEATWFERHHHPRSALATTRRFRARLTQEQWITSDFARRNGYVVPRSVADADPVVAEEYAACLRDRFLVLDAAAIGLHVPGHAWALGSLFQRLDCISHADWQALSTRTRRPRPGLDSLRGLARLARRPIARGVLFRKWVQTRRHAAFNQLSKE